MTERIFITRISYDLKNALKDCLLSLFYRKKDLIDFLRSCGSTTTELHGINDSLTKSLIVDMYYDNLSKRQDQGMIQYHSLIRQIIDWSDFDSYWFKNGQLDPLHAKEGIENLKELLGEKTKKEEERLKKRDADEAQEKIKARNKLISELREEFYKMCQLVEETQKRGYQLEELLNKLFGLFGFEVYKPFKLLGEQIDGAFKHDGENYIFESKWHDKETACNDLYHFAFKIESNSLYPRGVFFSINGYTDEALSRISFNKKTQLILFDAVDFIAVLEERITLPTLLDEKIRYAQTHAKIYVNANEILK